MSGFPRILRQLALVALGGLSGCDTATLDGTATDAATKESRQHKSLDERRQFGQVYGDWARVVGQLADLDLQYQTAAPHRRDVLKQQIDQRITEGNVFQEQVLEAAITAFAKAPEENADLTAFLVGVAYLLADQEEYDESLRLTQLLLDRGLSHDELYALAGMTAFAVGEFALAEKQLRRAAKEHSTLEKVAQYLRDIDYYKTGWDRENQLRVAEMSAGDLPRVLLQTTQGNLELELFENEAPNTVANFVWLVEQGFYDGLTFHRVLARTMAEAGCPHGDGTGGPGYTVPCECYGDNHRLHFRGSLSMVTAGRDTGGSQFCLTFVPLRNLDGRHTVFGRVVRGIDMLARLQTREPPGPMSQSLNPHSNVIIPAADKIITARVLRKRNHPYQPHFAQPPMAATD